ncbi:hypothetical protein QBC39DRAFT_136750 [Podospora conica]|nr:hypothetical protein QBC39DRAFT_136750 [Schizothecium conicum]
MAANSKDVSHWLSLKTKYRPHPHVWEVDAECNHPLPSLFATVQSSNRPLFIAAPLRPSQKLVLWLAETPESIKTTPVLHVRAPTPSPVSSLDHCPTTATGNTTSIDLPTRESGPHKMVRRSTAISLLALALLFLIGKLPRELFGPHFFLQVVAINTLNAFSGATTACSILQYYRIGKQASSTRESDNRCLLIGVGVGTGMATYGLWGRVHGLYGGMAGDVRTFLWKVSRGRKPWD